MSMEKEYWQDTENGRGSPGVFFLAAKTLRKINEKSFIQATNEFSYTVDLKYKLWLVTQTSTGRILHFIEV